MPMKVTRAQAEQNRERILDSAAQLFRERGVDGVGLNELMQAAGLTRGGFYGHFESKEDLVAQASRRALAGNVQQRRKVADKGLAPWVKSYLSDLHCRHVGEGCGLTALAADAARGPQAMREAFGEGVEEFVQTLLPLMPGTSPAQRREQALARVATLVGALLLGRAVADGAQSAELRAAAQKAVLSGTA
jgi:TetR/AcrR family transcriptional repressor of nem operon